MDIEVTSDEAIEEIKQLDPRLLELAIQRVANRKLSNILDEFIANQKEEVEG